MKRVSTLELIVLGRLSHHQFPDPVKEYQFHPTRKWRFDFAYPERKIAIECEGAVWSQGRHTRGGGYISDCEKYNAAVLLGWKVLRYSRGTIDSIGDDLRNLFAQKTNKTEGGFVLPKDAPEYIIKACQEEVLKNPRLSLEFLP